MSLLYNHAKFPDNPELVRRVANGTARLYEKLAALDLDRLDLSDYNKKYLHRYQRKLRSNLQKFGYILAWGLAQSEKPLNRTVLVEYGGGAGILSLLARECHVGTVIYNDIYDVSVLDAETIGQATGNTVNGYVCGEIGEIREFLQRHSISCDVMISSDVIEHIYNIGEFFTAIRGLSRGRLSVAMSTHANPHNPFVNRLLAKKQTQVEYEDREYSSGHKKRDSLRSYLTMRRNIVVKYGDGLLSNEEIERLAKVTRGMIDVDIRSAVFTYLKSKALPAPLSHPTNTCDPSTGNWADRLADSHHLSKGLAEAGFDVRVLAGHYGKPNGLIKRMLARMLDLLITVIPSQGLRLAPFFLICGSGDMSLLPQPEPVDAKELSKKARELV